MNRDAVLQDDLSAFRRNVTFPPVQPCRVGEGDEKSSSCLIHQNIPCEFWAHSHVSDAKSSHKGLSGDGCTQVNYGPICQLNVTVMNPRWLLFALQQSANFQMLLSNHMYCEEHGSLGSSQMGGATSAKSILS